jgi:hypothetical protein
MSQLASRVAGSRRGFRRATAMRALLLSTAAFALVGCSRHREDAWSRKWPARVPAGGTVTFRGEPVAEATVVFVTQRDGRFYNAIARTDSAGRFKLQTFRPQDGAVPGSHTVKIEKITTTEKPADLPLEAGFTPVETSHLPKKYRSPETSGLTAEVTATGTNEFTFALE